MEGGVVGEREQALAVGGDDVDLCVLRRVVGEGRRTRPPTPSSWISDFPRWSLVKAVFVAPRFGIRCSRCPTARHSWCQARASSRAALA
jgi:hypothetical protein